MGDVTSSDVLRALAEKHAGRRDAFWTGVYDGPVQSRNRWNVLDGLAMARSWARPCLHGYEVKVSRSDFIRDEKWPEYLRMCHRLSFAAPPGVIRPEEVDARCGLLLYNADKRTVRTVRAAPYRAIELPADMLYHLLISHADSDRLPFASSASAYWSEWLETKKRDRELGQRVSGALGRRLRELLEQVEEQTRDLRVLGALRAVLAENGLHVGDHMMWHWQEELRLRLRGRPRGDPRRMLTDARASIDAALAMLEPEEGHGGQGVANVALGDLRRVGD